MTEYKSTQELINMMNIFSKENAERYNQSMTMNDKWNKIICSIKEKNVDGEYYHVGEKIASHCRIIDLKNGILLIETDHPGWTQKLQFNSKYILTGLKKEIPELEIKSLAFKLKGERN